MKAQQIDIVVEAAADPATVFALLRDGAGWPSWSPIGSFELERPGADEPEGIGAIRAFRTSQWGRRVTSREEIVEIVPDRRFSYTLLSGLPLRELRADVDLEPSETGTSIHWHESFQATVPGTGWFYRRVLGSFIRECVQGLAARAASGRRGSAVAEVDDP